MKLRISLNLMAGFILVSLSAVAQVPSPATPGAVMPREGFKYPTPFKYPQASVPVEEETEEQKQVEEIIEKTERGAPRMQVKGFRIAGVDDDTAHGINQNIIDQLVKNKAQDMLKTEASKGFTISMFETITNTISRYYRQQGYILAKAYIPEQSISDGIVTINVVEGFLDQVVFSNNDLYSDTQLNKLFKPLLGESVFKQDIEDVLFQINDYPGLKASLIFGPGLKPGSSAIQLNALETPSETMLSFDNYGSTYTGENRLRANHRLNNAFHKADQLNLNFILTTSPANSQYYDVNYVQPIALYGYSLLAQGGLQVNTFDVGGNLSELGINGDSQIISGSLRYLHSRTRQENMSLTLGLSLKSSESKIKSTIDSKDALTVISFSGDYAGTSWSSSNAFQSLNVTLDFGLADFLGSMDSNGDGLSGRTSGDEEKASGGFTKISFAYSYIHQLKALENITFSLKGQSSSDLLTSLEQYSLGGVDNVRAYPVAEALMDTVFVGSVEWSFFASPDIQQTWLNKLQFSVFYDLAKGTLNEPLKNEIDTVNFSNFGASVQLEPFNQVKLKASYAIVTGDEESDDRTWPFYINASYEF